MSNPLSIYTPPPRPRPVQSHPTDIGLSLFKKARSSSQRASRYNPNSAFAKIGRRQTTGGRPRVEGVKGSSIAEVSREFEARFAAAADAVRTTNENINNDDDDDDKIGSHESTNELFQENSNDSLPSLEDLFTQTGPCWDSGAHTLRVRHIKPSPGHWGARELERFQQLKKQTPARITTTTTTTTKSLQTKPDSSDIIPRPSTPGEGRAELGLPPAPSQSAAGLAGRPQGRKVGGREGDGGGVGGGEGRNRVRFSV